MVRTLRRLLSLVLVAGLTLINVQAAELHVHAAAGYVAEAHRHGPASHHHDEVDDHSSDTAQVAGLDSDDTVVHVALVAASPQSVKPLHAKCEVAPSFELDPPSIIDSARIVARAHGPPSLAQPSLRAPPALASL